VKVFALVNGSDTAGTHYRLAQAFKAHGGPNWTLRTMAAATNYIDYPIDLPWDQRELERRYDEADVIHVSHFLFGHDNYDAGQGKPTVLVHHGLSDGKTADVFEGKAAAHRIFADRVAATRDAGVVQLASTYDLVVYAPELFWSPTAYDLDWLRALRAQHYWPETGGERPAKAPVRIVHAPTNRAVKGTDLIVAAVAELVRQGHNLDLVLTEHQTWTESLVNIARADIAFDQPILGYGCFAVEAMGMGVPVIAGVVNDEVREGMRAEWGLLPFWQVEPTVASIRAALLFLTEPVIRTERVDIGTRHVERYHKASKVVERLKPIYAGAGPSKPGGSARRITLVGGALIPKPPKKPVRPAQAWRRARMVQRTARGR
jgi:hypothetical protein